MLNSNFCLCLLGYFNDILHRWLGFSSLTSWLTYSVTHQLSHQHFCTSCAPRSSFEVDELSVCFHRLNYCAIFVVLLVQPIDSLIWNVCTNTTAVHTQFNNVFSFSGKSEAFSSFGFWAKMLLLLRTLVNTVIPCAVMELSEEQNITVGVLSSTV